MQPVDGDLMVAGLGIEADPVEATGTRSEVVQGFVATGNRKFEGRRDCVEGSVRNAHSPNELVNPDDGFLMELGGQLDHRSPATLGAGTSPAIVASDGNLLHNDGGFVDSVPRWATSDRFGVAGVDVKFIVEHRAAYAVGRKGIPVALDDGGESKMEARIEAGAESDDLVEEWVPYNQICALQAILMGRPREGATVAGEKNDIGVDVVILERWSVAAFWFGSPNLGRNGDDKRLDVGREDGKHPSNISSGE